MTARRGNGRVGLVPAGLLCLALGAAGPAMPAPAGVSAEAFVAWVMAEPEAHAHGDDPRMALEHAQLLALVPRAEATHVALRDGGWFDPATWHGGRVPGEGAKALIPEGVRVAYDGRSDAALFTLRVDGELRFATRADTRMVVDTLVVSPSGRLEIGTAADPVRAEVRAEVLIPGDGDIDVAWDPALLSRGVVSHGEVEIHGAEKTPFLKVAAAPRTGDATIRLAEAPEGWRAGDALVVTGTHKQGWVWDDALGRVVHRESQDEEATVASVEGATVVLERPLRHAHDAPRPDLAAYVANMTRNVTFASAGGADTPVRRRGHAMFMHGGGVDVRHAAFEDLGRTDKSAPAADVGTFARTAPDSNVKGRYALHLHRTGTEDRDHPATVLGSVVSGSPGWGFVQHSSHADFVENVAFDVFGAAFAAEDGDETGLWLRNLAVRSQGIGYGAWAAKEGPDVWRHDNGRTGDGFFFAGRLVEAAENVAANTTNGFVWMHRSAPAGPLAANLHQPEIAYGAETVGVSIPVIQGFRDNEAFGTHSGLIVIKTSPGQNHDLRSVIDGFTNWETSEGVSLSYTAHYTLKDLDLVRHRGAISTPGGGTAVTLGDDAFDLVFNGIAAQGFDIGADFGGEGASFAGDDFGNVLIDARFRGVGVHYVGFDPARHKVLTSDDLIPGGPAFDMRGDVTLSMDEGLRFDGTKTDSLGARDRQFAGDVQGLDFHTGVARLLATEGYHLTPDGAKVLLVEDFVADRATGEPAKLAHVVTLQLSDAEIEGIWLTNELGGPIRKETVAPGGPAPEARADAAATGLERAVVLDVLANDRDPEGGTLRVDGLTDPRHGEVRLLDDGRLSYRPEPGFSGEDAFAYWATDGEGSFSKAAVTVEVWDGLP